MHRDGRPLDLPGTIPVPAFALEGTYRMDALTDSICHSLRALAEEWGVERISVKIPIWYEVNGELASKIPVSSETQNEIVIVVSDQNRELFRRTFTMPDCTGDVSFDLEAGALS